jgi:Sugar-binding cellulase-like
MTMSRQQFLAGMLGLAACAVTAPGAAAANNARRPGTKAPLAIAMWDFSWLERRWPGAGYEDWDRALDGLAERGYDAVRIDPYPHLLAADPHKTWTLLPKWNTDDWGSPDVNRIVLLPALFQFIGKCRDRGIMVGLSTWYRQDEDNTRMHISGPEVLAKQWLKTLDLIAGAGLLDTILYTDLCNEWPEYNWAPFLKPNLDAEGWVVPSSLDFMHRAIAQVRARYPKMPLLFSCSSERVESFLEHDLSDFDLFDPHTWMTTENDGEFAKIVGYNYETFDPKGYTNLSLKAEPTYRARPQYWQDLLTTKIDRLAAVSAKMNKPLITTECWAIVDYKDWPLLKWDWVKDLCQLGVQHAASKGQWLAIATSNFCGPQFEGMWRDVRWHREMTALIRSGPIAADLRSGRLWDRL